MRKISITEPLRLSEREWRFDTVPDTEMDVCFLYEYGREQAKSSKKWKMLADQLHARNSAGRGAKGKTKPFLELFDAIGSIFGKGKSLSWCCDPAFVTTPWQALDEKLRRDEARQFKEQNSQAQSLQEFICLSIALERDLPKYEKAGATDYRSWALLDKLMHDETEQREYGFLAVNWNYTNDQLIDEFKKWLDEKREDRKAVESQQGKAKARQYLRALGAKRLLDSGLTVAAAMEYTEKFLKDERDAPRPLYESERGWSKAKNETVPSVLKRLFPTTG